MNNAHAIQNFLFHARMLRNEGKGLTVKRDTFGGCTELRATQDGTSDSTVLYMSRGNMTSTVTFTRAR